MPTARKNRRIAAAAYSVNLSGAGSVLSRLIILKTGQSTDNYDVVSQEFLLLCRSRPGSLDNSSFHLRTLDVFYMPWTTLRHVCLVRCQAGGGYPRNWNPGGRRGVYNNHPEDTPYDSDVNQWAIYNLDGAPMPEGACFNVAVSAGAEDSNR